MSNQQKTTLHANLHCLGQNNAFCVPNTLLDSRHNKHAHAQQLTIM